MLQNLPSQVLQSSMSRRSAEIEMDTIQHVALSGDQQPGVRCWPVAAVAEWVSFGTIGGGCKIKGHGVSKFSREMERKMDSSRVWVVTASQNCSDVFAHKVFRGGV